MRKISRIKIKERPPVKDNMKEILESIKQGHENAEAFAERCKPTYEDMHKRVTI